jgi:hypothetical protein
VSCYYKRNRNSNVEPNEESDRMKLVYFFVKGCPDLPQSSPIVFFAVPLSHRIIRHIGRNVRFTVRS